MTTHRSYLITYENKDGNVKFTRERFISVKEKKVATLKRRADIVGIDVLVYRDINAEKLVESWKRRKMLGMLTKFWKRVDKG